MDDIITKVGEASWDFNVVKLTASASSFRQVTCPVTLCISNTNILSLCFSHHHAWISEGSVHWEFGQIPRHTLLAFKDILPAH